MINKASYIAIIFSYNPVLGIILCPLSVALIRRVLWKEVLGYHRVFIQTLLSDTNGTTSIAGGLLSYLFTSCLSYSKYLDCTIGFLLDILKNSQVCLFWIMNFCITFQYYIHTFKGQLLHLEKLYPACRKYLLMICYKD